MNLQTELEAVHKLPTAEIVSNLNNHGDQLELLLTMVTEAQGDIVTLNAHNKELVNKILQLEEVVINLRGQK